MADQEVAADVLKERVPESYITRIKARPMRKIPPLRDGLFGENPRRRERIQAGINRINYMVDMEQDCLRQHAEIGVRFTSDGIKTVFILPNDNQATSSS